MHNEHWRFIAFVIRGKSVIIAKYFQCDSKKYLTGRFVMIVRGVATSAVKTRCFSTGTHGVNQFQCSFHKSNTRVKYVMEER